MCIVFKILLHISVVYVVDEFNLGIRNHGTPKVCQQRFYNAEKIYV